MTRTAAFAAASLALLAPAAAQAQDSSATRRATITTTAIAPTILPGIRRVRPAGSTAQQALRQDVPTLRTTAIAPGPLCEDCVSAINGRAIAGTTFTPGTGDAASVYTIVGNGFGDVAGSVFLTGAFNTRPELRVESWSNRQIRVSFARGLRGEPDRQGVGVSVKLASGRLISTAQTARFVAARERQEIAFSDIPKRALRTQSNTSLIMFEKNGGLTYTGTDIGDSVKTGYTDRVVVDFLNGGFVPTEFNVGFCRQDTGQGSVGGEAGGRYLYGRYDARWEGNDIVIERAMWQDHRSPFLALPARDTFLSCFRDLRITVEGPAGLKPIG